MFYMLTNVHHQITIGEVLPLPNYFWYYLPDLPFRIQNVATSFQLELEHLTSHELWRGRPLAAHLLEILSGNGPEYDSDDIDCYTLPYMCYHIDGEVLAEEAPGLTSHAGLVGGPGGHQGRARVPKARACWAARHAAPCQR